MPDERLEGTEDGLDAHTSGKIDLRTVMQHFAEGHAAVLSAIARGTEAVKAHIDRRIDPLEKALRGHLRT